MQSTLADKQITSSRKQGDFSCSVFAVTIGFLNKMEICGMIKIISSPLHKQNSFTLHSIHRSIAVRLGRRGSNCHFQNGTCNSTCKTQADVPLAAVDGQPSHLLKHNSWGSASSCSHWDHALGTWEKALFFLNYSELFSGCISELFQNSDLINRRGRPEYITLTEQVWNPSLNQSLTQYVQMNQTLQLHSLHNLWLQWF